MIFLKVGWTKLDENFDPMKLQEINYKNDSWISINGENTIPSDQAIFFVTEFRKMLSVVLARPLNTTQLSKKGIDKCTQKPLTEDIYFLEPRFKNNEDKLFIYEMFLQNIDIQLNNLIPNWFNKDENVELRNCQIFCVNRSFS